jgi:hypothetical protein
MDYFISSHFSLGADYRILFRTEFQKYDYDSNDQVTEESSYKSLSNVAALRFRFYF